MTIDRPLNYIPTYSYFFVTCLETSDHANDEINDRFCCFLTMPFNVLSIFFHFLTFSKNWSEDSINVISG